MLQNILDLNKYNTRCFPNHFVVCLTNFACFFVHYCHFEIQIPLNVFGVAVAFPSEHISYFDVVLCSVVFQHIQLQLIEVPLQFRGWCRSYQQQLFTLPVSKFGSKHQQYSFSSDYFLAALLVLFQYIKCLCRGIHLMSDIVALYTTSVFVFHNSFVCRMLEWFIPAANKIPK